MVMQGVSANFAPSPVYRSCVEDNFNEPLGMDDLGALDVDDHATSNAHDVCRSSTEVIVPRSRCRPHFVVLQQVRVNKHTKLSAVTKGRHAKFGLGNPFHSK